MEDILQELKGILYEKAAHFSYQKNAVKLKVLALSALFKDTCLLKNIQENRIGFPQ